MDIAPIIAALKRQKTAAALIAIEIALSCAIICNVLFLITHRLERSHVPSGVVEDELVYIRTAGIGASGGDDPMVRAREDRAALASIPGVKSATIINQIPFGHSSWNTGVKLAADQQQTSANVGAYYADEHMLDSFGVKLIAGRQFTSDEFLNFDDVLKGKSDPPSSMIITKTLARRLFGDENAIGKNIYLDDTKPTRVIGIVEHLIRPNFGSDLIDADSSMILPVRLSLGYGQFVLRTDPGNRDAVIAAARKKLKEVSPNRIVLDAKTLESARSDYFKQDRVMAGLLVAVVISLLIVTALGIVGLASFWVQRRRRQIGIRRALGATRRQILHYFQTENFLIVTVGIVIGMGAAYAISGWLMHQYELPRLPLYYLPVGAVALWLLGQLSVLAPALRAASVPPATATRTV
ncbi:ABC transporter permease [Solimonas terrae]|uniref:FtsX-like permease family protein n=1 Tax=Solimonas terrae TaxID=1396819 RepID=A0A6M2BQ02_9GAMM|nr:FtsX-like permease family protein [Solimonas terrae]NGY04163.1 FtsX-like permease family protein [Solimonas terrae]